MAITTQNPATRADSARRALAAGTQTVLGPRSADRLLLERDIARYERLLKHARAQLAALDAAPSAVTAADVAHLIAETEAP